MGLIWPVAAGVALFLWIRAYGVVRIARSEEQNARLFVHHRLPRNTRHGIRAISLALAATAVAGLSLTALFLSWSRGAWLGAAAAAVAMLVVLLRRPMPTLAILGVSAVIFVGLSGAGLLPGSIQARLTDFTQQFQSFDVRGVGITADNYAVVERLAHWQAAQNMIQDRPYTGVGFGNYEAAYDQYRTYAWPLALGHAHNYLLNIWAETGLPGLLAYLALWASAVVSCVRIAWRKDDRPFGKLRASRTTDDGGAPRSTLFASRLTFAACLAIGLLGAWAHLSVHNLFDNLFVANTYLLIGAYLGLLESIRQSPISNLQSLNHEHRNL
jgi:O-antigen ligase